MAAMETANPHHHGQQQHHQPYPALPASPTLTNPDMILPDYRSDSPDPDLNGRDHSPLMMWKNAHAASSAIDVSQSQQHPDHPYGPTGPITPTTPIIYGNGTMLSDIGEVTEAESTPARSGPMRSKGIHGVQRPTTRGSGSDTALRSSPTMGYEGVLKKRSKQSLAAAAQRERRSSIESTSTITTEKQDLFADFDDSVSVGDSVFQGDDEESMADSYTEGTPARESHARLEPPNTDNADRLSTYSMSSLSQRAEHILANAKKRLTTMEGNLTRARSSLHASSPSMSSIGSDGSTPSPPVKRNTAIFTQEQLGRSSPTSSPRVSSDGTSSSAPLSYRVTTQRSASSLGVSGGYRQPLSASRSVDHLGNLDGRPMSPAQRISWHQKDRALEPLSEDEVALTQAPNRFSKGVKLDQFLSPTFGSFSDSGNGNERVIQRSASVAQMRGLKDQVKDLKGKISNLREQARADSLKRRSLQSLRTPSPFTHAQVDQWYADPEQPTSSEAEGTSATSGRNPWNGELSSVDGDEQARESGPEKYTEDEDSIYSEVENETQLRPPGNQSPERQVAATVAEPDHAATEEGGDDDSDMQTENGDIGREDQVDVEQPGEPAAYESENESETESESGESLYHDTVQHPISHEDREDAFDYEHFFLHSAMGTISQQRLGRRGSRSSFSSEDSVETTRGPIVESNSPKDGSDKSASPPTRSMKRRSSDASVSTVGTFATANEGSAESNREKEDTLSRLSGQFATATTREGSESPGTSKKISFTPGGINTEFRLPASRRSTGSVASVPEEGKENRPPQAHFNYSASAFRRPMSSSAANSLHRPSVSSFESTGTNRSFPLVNRPKKSSSVGILTPHNISPDHELKAISDSLLNETASIFEKQQQEANGDGTKGHKAGSSLSSIVDALSGNPDGPEALQTLLREDQYLVERLVASLGRCVLGLTESGRASVESRAYRRRIDAARRILEGVDEVV